MRMIRRVLPRLLLVALGGAAATAFGAEPVGVPVAGPIGDAVAVSPAGRNAATPDVARAPDGTLYVLWVDRGPAVPPTAQAGHAGPRSHNSSVDVVIASSRDGGRTFGTPVRVNAEAGEVWSFPTARPKLSIGPDGTLHVLYTANGRNAAGKPVIVPRYTHSSDGGRTFAPPRLLASIPDGDLGHVIHGGFAQAQTFGTLLADRAGGVHVYWIDTRFMQGPSDSAALMSAYSADGGRTFGTERVLERSGACPCCQLTASLGTGSAVYLGVRHVEDGQRDSWVYASDDHGLNFRQRVRLGDMRWKIDGCPLKPTAVAAHGADVYAAAFNGATEQTGVRFAASADGGRTFGRFELLHPDAAVSDAPAVVALGDSAVRVFWHAKAAGDAGRAIYGALSTDGGRTFHRVEKLAGGENVGYPAVTLLAGGAAGLAYGSGEQVWFRVVPGPSARTAQR